MSAEAARAAARAAQAERNAGRRAEALALQRQAVALMEAAGETAGHAHALRHEADILSDLGEHGAAGRLYDRVLALYAAGGFDALDHANAVRGAAVNAARAGDRDAARRLWQEARTRYAALDTRFDGPNPGVIEAEHWLHGLG